MIRRGWRVASEGRFLEKGEGRHRVQRAMNGYIGSTPAPWDVKYYNPVLHCPAALMGATYVRPGRFRLGSLLVDENGSPRNEQEECGVCGALPKDTYRRVRIENPDPFAEPWKQKFAPCPRCAGNRV